MLFPSLFVFPSPLIVSSSSAIPKKFGILLSPLSLSLSLSFVSSFDPPKKFDIMLPVPMFFSLPLSSLFVSSFGLPKSDESTLPSSPPPSPPSSPPPSPPSSPPPSPPSSPPPPSSSA